ncbi:MAG: hypothetical protein NVS1B7_5690 [Candidatus Saccharimonadales bacterium]
MENVILSVTEFVELFNQTLEYAYPSITVIGEISSLRVSKGKWVYFNLKDDQSSVKFFSTVFQMPGPLEDGMLLQVRGVPRLHRQFGFTINVQHMQPVGEGSLRKAAELLEAKLSAEGLFDASRKRVIPYPPKNIGLVTSGESAAYQDFIKILGERWRGILIRHYDVQVQGEIAPAQIVTAIEYFNSHSEPVDVLVIIRGGGSIDDLSAFSTEQVARSVAGSRIPTLVAIGHEADISLAERVADLHASTPSNAAELLVPDIKDELSKISTRKVQFYLAISSQVKSNKNDILQKIKILELECRRVCADAASGLQQRRKLLLALSPENALKRGYAIVRLKSLAIASVKQVKKNDDIILQFKDGSVDAKIL